MNNNNKRANEQEYNILYSELGEIEGFCFYVNGVKFIHINEKLIGEADRIAKLVKKGKNWLNIEDFMILES